MRQHGDPALQHPAKILGEHDASITYRYVCLAVSLAAFMKKSTAFQNGDCCWGFMFTDYIGESIRKTERGHYLLSSAADESSVKYTEVVVPVSLLALLSSIYLSKMCEVSFKIPCLKAANLNIFSRALKEESYAARIRIGWNSFRG